MNLKLKNLYVVILTALIAGCSVNNSNSSASNNSSSQIGGNSTTSSSTPSLSTGGYETPTENSYSYESLATSDYREFLSFTGEGWKFHKGELANGHLSTINDSSWTNVTIPHTWNNTDAQDGGGNYERCESWYHYRVEIGNDFLEDQKQYIEFLGVNMQAKVYVNDEFVGSHKGGYTGFRFDVTDYLVEGENFFAVWVSNVKTQDIAPLGADFNFYGGIYREVNLFTLPTVHVDMNDYGSSGLKLTTSDVSEEAAKLKIESRIVNEALSNDDITIKATLKVPDTFEEISQIPTPDFDIKALTTGETIKVVEEDVSISANNLYKFEAQITVENPKLWNGRKSPFRYQVILDIIQDGEIIDQVSSYVGFRTFEVTKTGGSFLNGESYPLRGVSRHQEWKNQGNAISKMNHNVDFGFMYEMGVNSIRLAHYPQSNYMYDLCDRYGIVVWAEIPFLNHVGTADNFLEVTQLQLTELIRQQFNRPSIVVWGLQNEVEASYNSAMVKLMYALNKTAHEEDPTRMTTQATNSVTAKYWSSDLLAWNTYPGWYSGTTLSANMDDYRNNYSMPVGISEYGYGANINQHADYPTRGTNDVYPEGQWHPQEYQNQQHELAVHQVTSEDRNDIWCAYIWNMFDFASDSRWEGSQPGMNDKGLISYDRKTKKDTFYLYKANWNKKDKFVHLTSADYTNRSAAGTYVKAYSNCDKLALYINNNLIGTLENNGYGIFSWDVTLPTGNIDVRVQVLDEGYENLSESANWSRSLSTNTTIKSNTLAIDNDNRVVMFNNGVSVSEFVAQLDSNYNCSYAIFDNSGQKVTSGLVTEDMKLYVYAENSAYYKVFTLKKAHLSTNKPVTVSSSESSNIGSYVVDGNESTRWASSNSSYPQTLIIDLEGEFTLEEIDISWYISGTRAYKYKLYIGDSNEVYTLVADRSYNTTSGLINDELNGIRGRYIKIEVVGCSDSSGYASIYEVVVKGWGINSTNYQVNESDKTITIDTDLFEISLDQFLKDLKCEGDYELSLSSSNNVVMHGDTITIVDTAGNTRVYTIIFA